MEKDYDMNRPKFDPFLYKQQKRKSNYDLFESISILKFCFYTPTSYSVYKSRIIIAR